MFHRARHIQPLLNCIPCVLLMLCLALSAPAAEPPDAPPVLPADSPPSPPTDAKHTTETVRGKVVWMAEAMQRLFDVETDSDVAESQIAIETKARELWPVIKDSRGRGFYLDERLRGIEVELVARRYVGSPALQVIRLYSLHDDKKYELDYWCDICAIPMYELKACECCQGETRIRQRLVRDGMTTAEELR